MRRTITIVSDLVPTANDFTYFRSNGFSMEKYGEEGKEGVEVVGIPEDFDQFEFMEKDKFSKNILSNFISDIFSKYVNYDYA